MALPPVFIGLGLEPWPSRCKRGALSDCATTPRTAVPDGTGPPAPAVCRRPEWDPAGRDLLPFAELGSANGRSLTPLHQIVIPAQRARIVQPAGAIGVSWPVFMRASAT